MDDFLTLWATFGTWIFSVLPSSPFQPYISIINSSINPFLGYLNWFLPISEMLGIMGIWLGAILIYYGVQAIGRWLRILGD